MKKLTTITLLLISVFSYGQEISPGFVALSVKNIDAEQKWYCDNLGFAVKKAAGTVGPGVRFGLLSGNGMLIELIEDKKSEAKTSTSAALPYGIFKFGFRVNDLDKLVSTLAGKGIKPKYGPFKGTPTDPANFIIDDPEGNLIQFFEMR